MKQTLLRQLLALRQDAWTIADLEKVTGLDRSSLYVALHRWVGAGWMERLRRGLYRLTLIPSETERVAHQLYLPNYLSFESALAKWGAYSQLPYTLTFATTRKSKRMTLAGTAIEFRHLNPQLFFGYQSRDGILVATQEKALLDLAYLAHLGKATWDPEAVNWRLIDQAQLSRLLKRYPSSLRQTLLRHFPR